MFLSHDEQTIIAQCTPRGSGAIALLRVCGINAIEIVDRISNLASGKKLVDLPTHTIHYGSIINQTTSIDNVLFLLMRGPKTFTGQDTIEITCHNNQFIIEEIISLAINTGARLSQEGEFSKRAVLNGKIDLVQAEAINELIHAQTQMALKQSLAQMDGSFSQWLTVLEKDLIKALALSEASFEFLDEEMEFAPQIQAIIASVTSNINSIKKTFNQQQHIRQGIRIAIIGSVNAGKSSLFNALLNQNRAIVNAQAGTTRDVIEAGLFKNGNYWTLVDTAGLRQTDDSIEQEGIRRSLEEAHKADIIILAYDSSREITQQETSVYEEIKHKYPNKMICVFTKADASIHAVTEAIFVSSKNKLNINILEQMIEQKIATLFASIESPFLLNQRQHNLLLALEHKLTDIISMLAQKPVAYELLSIHLNDAIAHLAELSGKAISEAGMDMIFREFCIGK
jgi:tRNA modification GTPase